MKSEKQKVRSEDGRKRGDNLSINDRRYVLAYSAPWRISVVAPLRESWITFDLRRGSILRRHACRLSLGPSQSIHLARDSHVLANSNP